MPGRRHKEKGRLAAAFSVRRAAYSIGFFAPPLYEYRVVAAFFSSPFGSNAILAVTPWYCVSISLGM